MNGQNMPDNSTFPFIQKDTSFTIQSALIKESKKYPFISIAKPSLRDGIHSRPNVVYSSSGGRDLHADILYPLRDASKLYPAVLLVHGGGWKSGDKSQMAGIAMELAKSGYITVSAEYRLSPEASYPAALHDLKAAVRWIREKSSVYGIDTHRIAVLGVSAGGQLASLLGTTNGMRKFEGNGGHSSRSSRVQAVINVDGILAFDHPESEEGKVAAEWLGGNLEEKPKMWQEASALTHAGARTPSMLFINSQHIRFHAGRDDLINKISPFGIYTEVQTLPDTPHTFWLFNPWFEPVINYSLDYLNEVFSKPSK